MFRHPTSAWCDAPAPRSYDESFAAHTGASTRYFFAGEACSDDVLRACLVHSEAHGAEAFYRVKRAEQDKKDKAAAARRKKADPPRYDWVAVAGARRDPPHPPTAMVRDARPNSFGLDDPSGFVYVDHWPWRVPARTAARAARRPARRPARPESAAGARRRGRCRPRARASTTLGSRSSSRARAGPPATRVSRTCTVTRACATTGATTPRRGASAARASAPSSKPRTCSRRWTTCDGISCASRV